ncbi:MAG: FtsX-like permease family protein [Bacteroidia bacterium]|nr:FtsX-like permease family protein [Bacteroidia bacterium]
MSKASQLRNSERAAFRFLRWFCPPDLLEEIEGDLLERYDRDAAKATPAIAHRRLLWNVLRYFRPGILLRHTLSNPIPTLMIKSYFTTASRSLRAHRSNTFINVVGLVVGIASAIILLSIIRFETSFEHQHTALDRIYRIVRVSQVEGQTEYRTGVSYPLPPVIDEEVPQVEVITSVLYWGWAGIQVDVTDETGKSHNKFQENSGFAFVEPSFFSIFDYAHSEFRWLYGNPESSLSQPDNIVLTRDLAMKYFGTTDAVGKTVRVDNDWNCKITGVIENIPENSDFPFTFLMSYATLNRDIGHRMDNWWSVGDNEAYIKLKPGATCEETDAQIEKAHAAHTPQELHSYRKYKLQPLAELHTDDRFGNFNQRVVSQEKIWMLAVIALFLVLVACINYINLSTAQSSMRSKEIGIRKVLGSLRKQLIYQFMAETLLVTLIASACGLLLAEVASTTFQSLLSIPTQRHIISDPFILKALGIMVVVVSLLAGVYPAFVLSGFNPIAAIKTKLAGHASRFQLRKVLVVAQFCITQFCDGHFRGDATTRLLQQYGSGVRQESDRQHGTSKHRSFTAWYPYIIASGRPCRHRPQCQFHRTVRQQATLVLRRYTEKGCRLQRGPCI